MTQTVGNLSATGRELLHYLLVQPNVHARRVLGIAGVAELASQGFSILEAGIEVYELHEIHNGGLPVQFLMLARRHLNEDSLNIDLRTRPRRRRGLRSGRWGLGARRRCRRCCWRSAGWTACLDGSRVQFSAQNCVFQSVEDAHAIPSFEEFGAVRGASSR